MAKLVKVAAALSAAQRRVVSQAAKLGYDASGGFEAAVSFLAKHKPQGEALASIERQYKAGYLVKYRELRERGYAKRSSNQPLEIKVEVALEIMSKSRFDPSKSVQKKGARTEDEQRGYRAANSSWSLAKGRAGLSVIAKRKPKAKKAEPDTTPVDLSKLTPSFKDKVAANDWFQNVAVALRQACDSNNSRSKAKLVSPQLTSAVEDFQKAVKLALGVK